MSRSKIQNMTRCALSAGLMAVCAWITVPMAVPFTMQTFGVFLTLGLLGGKLGTVAIGVYLLVGLAGLPVFSGFRGGIGVLLGATGGYLAGFAVAGLLYWLLEKLRLPTALRMGLGMLGCYAFGTIWFLISYAGGSSLWAVLSACVFPFLIPDAAKIALAWYLTRRIKPYL